VPDKNNFRQPTNKFQFEKIVYPRPGQSQVHMLWSSAPCNVTCWNHGNMFMDAYRDPSIETFVVQHPWMENDCYFADIILPDLTPQETYSMSAAGEYNDSLGLWMGNPIGEPVEERREVYEVCGEIAERLGVGDAYTEGKTREQWRHELYDEMRKEYPQLPTYEKMQEIGIYKEAVTVSDEVDPYIKDPEANPLETATGKIQVYSPELAELAKTWELAEGDEISPIPIYTPGFEGPGTTTDEYPLQVLCFHWRAHTHSTYMNNEVVQKSAANQLWMNPIDAAERGIADCDDVYVETKRGKIQIQAKVTNRMMPGVVAMPEGMWRDADETGLDKGGCINTLTSRHVNPVSKATGQHSNIGQVTKVGA
jgi:Tat-targeted selenate reductase subunit YnfE